MSALGGAESKSTVKRALPPSRWATIGPCAFACAHTTVVGWPMLGPTELCAFHIQCGMGCQGHRMAKTCVHAHAMF